MSLALNLYLDPSGNLLRRRGFSDRYSMASSKVQVKRGNTYTVSILLVTDDLTTPRNLAAGAIVGIALKRKGVFESSEILAYAESSTDPDAGDPYVMTLTVASSALDDYMAVDGNVTNDLASVEAELEVYWTEDAWVTKGATSDRILAVIVNNVRHGDEPAPSPTPSSEDWLTARALRYDAAQTLTAEEQQQGQINLGTEYPKSLVLAGSITDGTGNIGPILLEGTYENAWAAGGAVGLSYSIEVGDPYETYTETWVIVVYLDGVYLGRWYTEDEVPYPHLATTWVLEDGPMGGTPVVMSGNHLGKLGIRAASPILTFATDADKLDATGLMVGDIVRITDEADRIEMFIGPTGYEGFQEGWLVLRNTAYAYVTNNSGGSIDVNGVTVADAASSVGVGWVDPTNIPITASNLPIKEFSLYDPSNSSSVQYIPNGYTDYYYSNSGGSGIVSIPGAQPRGILTLKF